jgi:hypothetical protein
MNSLIAEAFFPLFAFHFSLYFVPLHALWRIVMEKKKHALRKLLEAVEKELLHKPDKKTLDRLSLLAGFQDWESFQETLHGELGGETIYGGHGRKKETPKA